MRNENESVEDWYSRTLLEYREAEAELLEHWHRLGLHLPAPPGQPQQLLDDEYTDALERARDLEDEMLQASKTAAKHRAHPALN